MMETQVIALVAAFNSNKELLLLKRPNNVHQGGLWSFPGGKVEDNEAPLDAAARELKEETGLNGEHWQKIGRKSHAYKDRRLQFLMFACLCPDISAIHCESEHAWASPGKLRDYPMPEANSKLLPMLSKLKMDKPQHSR